MSPRPVWLLDVDGVLNATHPCPGGAPRTAVVHGEGRFTFRWDPRIVTRVRRLATSGRVDVRWSTTWVPWRAEVEDALGLPELPTAFMLDPAADWQTVDARKVQAALHVVERERAPLIWTDDMVVPETGELRERLENAGPPTLLLRPREHRGLTAAHLELIETFVSAHV